MSDMAKKKPENKRPKCTAVCPMDGTLLTDVGGATICSEDEGWRAFSDQFQCERGHNVFVVDKTHEREMELPKDDDDEDMYV